MKKRLPLAALVLLPALTTALLAYTTPTGVQVLGKTLNIKFR